MLGMRPHRAVPLVWGWSVGEQNVANIQNPDGSPNWRAEKIIRKTTLGRFGTPEEAAKAILAISAIEYVNLESIVVTGGAVEGQAF